MSRLIPNPDRDRGLTDPAWVWLHADGTTTPATDEEVDKLIDDDEPTLG